MSGYTNAITQSYRTKKCALSTIPPPLQITSNHALVYQHPPLHSRTSTQFKAPIGFTSVPTIDKRYVNITTTFHSDTNWLLGEANSGIVDFYVHTSDYKRASVVIYLLQHSARIQANDYMVVLNQQNTSAVLKFDGTQWRPIAANAKMAFPCAASAKQRRNPASLTLNSSLIPDTCVWVQMSPSGTVSAGYGDFATGQNLFAQVWDREFDVQRTRIRYFGFGYFHREALVELPETRVFNIQSWASTDGYFMGNEV